MYRADWISWIIYCSCLDLNCSVVFYYYFFFFSYRYSLNISTDFIVFTNRAWRLSIHDVYAFELAPPAHNYDASSGVLGAISRTFRTGVRSRETIADQCM